VPDAIVVVDPLLVILAVDEAVTRFKKQIIILKYWFKTLTLLSLFDGND